MPELDHPSHPQWCNLAHCNIGRPPLNGHVIGMHRSSPEAVSVTVLRLVQAQATQAPWVELRRGDIVLLLPILEAQSLAPAIDDLLRQAGVGL